MLNSLHQNICLLKYNIEMDLDFYVHVRVRVKKTRNWKTALTKEW